MNFKLTQRGKLLQALREMGDLGVNSYIATYELRIKQAPTRIKELREEGYDIVSKHNANRSVNWILQETKEKEYTYEFENGIAKRIIED